ncbi:hypothetical protein INT48_004247 [Thamnidium elegans]|uniref:Uncharacterized protein n=1 Tax=Thamnidium elegans TaxID=101142 RepID=A0A8H7SQV7_9FUNG|nr:hypothetical protein INT48_004247 [Thamnidium elegans]
MKFSLNKLLSVSALLALATLTIAAPLQDVSVTSIDVVENTFNAKGDEHLFVTVTRVDDLLDDDGSLLAERIMAVRVTFDVYENQLMCNGQPVEIGVSNIEVEAQMASNPAKLSITSAEEAAILADSFDVGLVKVEVTASILDELKTDDGMIFRRISVRELITEINGQRVVQTEAGQQILDVFDNGSLVKWSVDPLTGFMLPGPDVVDSSDFFFNPTHQEAENWWNEASDLSQGLIMGAIATFFLGLVLAVRQVINSTNSNYESVALGQDEEAEQVW